jgi:hypothetical protein
MVNGRELERGRVVIGVDPHKRSVTTEVMGSDEAVNGGGRFGTGRRSAGRVLVSRSGPGPERDFLVPGVAARCVPGRRWPSQDQSSGSGPS